MRELANSRPVGRLLCFWWVVILAMCGVQHGWAANPVRTQVLEALFGKGSGASKKDAAVEFVSSALNLSEAVANREIVDAAQFRDGLSKTIDGVVQCLNASAWAKAK